MLVTSAFMAVSLMTLVTPLAVANAGNRHTLCANRHVDGQRTSRVRLAGLAQRTDSSAVQSGLAGGCAVEHVTERGVSSSVLGLAACRNGDHRAGCSTEIVLCGHACAVRRSGLVLQAWPQRHRQHHR